MTAKILDGRAVSAKTLGRVRKEAGELAAEHGRVPVPATAETWRTRLRLSARPASPRFPAVWTDDDRRPRRADEKGGMGTRNVAWEGQMGKARDNYILDLARSRRGYALNLMCGSLRDSANRELFTADEAAYCEGFGLSPEQKRAILERDWIAMLDLGTSIFYAFKLAVTDQKSMQYLGGVFTGMTAEEFAAALRAGGRTFG